MSAYLNTRVSLYAASLWQAEDFDALLRAPDAEMADTLASHGLLQLAAGFNAPDSASQSNDPLSLEQRIIAQTLDETRVLIRPLTGAARSVMTTSSRCSARSASRLSNSPSSQIRRTSSGIWVTDESRR